MTKGKEQFIKKYGWMYRKMLANLPLDMTRKTFKKWLNDLGLIIDDNYKLK